MLLLADEPTGAPNQSAAQAVMAEFIRLNRKGATILVVTHDSKVAARCGILIFALRYQGSFCGVADVDPKKTVSYIEVFTD